MTVTRICVACKSYHTLDHFDPAHKDFPTRDGLQYNCRAANATTTYRLMRTASGRVEPIKPEAYNHD